MTFARHKTALVVVLLGLACAAIPVVEPNLPYIPGLHKLGVAFSGFQVGS